jgi:PBP1b-binding outer membrane lipoprotein LpoB
MISFILFTLVKKLAMINGKILGIAFAAALLVASCAGEPKEEIQHQPEVCMYTYNPGSTTMEWTAFKFTEKAPVKGTFTEINIEGEKAAEDPMDLLKSLNFSIPVATISSQNEERDAKIVKHFFGTIGTEKLTGRLIDLSPNGFAKMEIVMNGKLIPVKGSYTLVDGKFDFSTTIDVADWNAMSGITALNTICKDLHTGADKVSKLWSEVDITFSTTLTKECH